MSACKIVIEAVSVRVVRVSTRLAMAGWLLLVAGGENVLAGPPRELDLGVRQDGFQQKFDKKKEQKLRLIDITTAVENGRTSTAWIWEKRAAPEWKAKIGLTREEIQREVTASDMAGFRLVHLAAFANGSTDRFSAIWEKSDGPPMSIKYGVPHQKLEEVSRNLAQEGYRPVRVAAATFDRRAELTGVWEKTTDPPRELQVGLNSARFKTELRSRLRRGFRIIQICCYRANRQMRFACIWEKSAGPPQQVDLGVTRAAVERLGRQKERQEFVALQISSCTLKSRVLYTVVWEKKADKP